jgi:hypothetical protein
MVYWSDLYTFSGRPQEAGMTPATDPRLLLLNPADNCLVACRALPAGETLLIDGEPVTLPRPVGMAHKLARQALAVGDKVLRYGAVIGSVQRPIAIGEHIHTDNLKSDYLPTYTLQDGAKYVFTQHD